MPVNCQNALQNALYDVLLSEVIADINLKIALSQTLYFNAIAHAVQGGSKIWRRQNILMLSVINSKYNSKVQLTTTFFYVESICEICARYIHKI